MSRGFVFGTWNRQTFWRRGGGLPCSTPLLLTWLLWCVTLMFVAGLQQHALTENLNGTWNRPLGRHRIQIAEGPVLDPCAKQIYFRRDPKVDPLRIESGPSWRALFWSLHFVRCAEILQVAMRAECQAWSYLHKQHPRQDSWTGEARICVSNFSCLWGPKNRPFQTTTSWTPELARVATWNTVPSEYYEWAGRPKTVL